jgi:alpha-L-fucosidase
MVIGELILKTKNKWFNDVRFGMFIHWGIYSIPAKGEWVRFYDDISIEDYDKYAEQFNPVDFDPKEWAKTARNAGMRYVVFTTKHHDGFCMYDSKYTDFKITNTPYGRDITAELVEAFRAEEIKIGFYHSLVDWRHPHYIPDQEHPDGKDGNKEFPDRDLSIYRDYLYKQVEQLLTDYGKIDLLFFDYTSKYKDSSEWEAEKLLEKVYSLQPEIMVNDRLSYEKSPVLYGDYCTPEISLPNQQPVVNGKACDWETCMTLNNNWGYNVDDMEFKDPKTVVRALIHCTSMNGNLLINVGPDAQGNIPSESLEVLSGVGSWMEKCSCSIYGNHSAEFVPPVGCYYTAKEKGVLYLHLINPLMGDLILPQLNGRVERITVLADGEEVPLITFWGSELLKDDELRIRPPKHLSKEMIDVLKIELK